MLCMLAIIPCGIAGKKTSHYYTERDPIMEIDANNYAARWCRTEQNENKMKTKYNERNN